MGCARILVVDNEPSLLLTYTMILQQSGYEVTTAACAEEAGGILREFAFDLIICDLTLKKERDGFHVLELARSLHPRMSTILMTGLGSAEVAEQASSMGATPLFKPVEVKVLLHTIAEAIGRSQDNRRTHISG